MVGDMRWLRKFASEVINSKLHTTLPPPIRTQEKWKFCIWHCSTVPNSTKMIVFIAILLDAYSSNGIGGTPVNYAWLNSRTIILCFLDIVETQFRCGWKRGLFLLVCLLNYYFFRVSSRLLFKSFQDLAFRGMCFFWFWLIVV